jgi:hypothetical protein
MGIIDFLLNLAGLMLWLNWSVSPIEQVTGSPATLVGALKRAEPARFNRWPCLIGLVGLLLARAWIYWQIGPAVNWVPHLKLGAISIFFRSDVFSRVLLYSFLSFTLTLSVFYLWLLFLSLVNGRRAETEPVQRIVQIHLGWVDRWPWWIRLMLPALLATIAWLGVGPLLSQFKVIEPALSGLHRFEEAGIIALGTYLSWKYLIAGLLILWLFSAYVYLGNNAFWTFISTTGRNTLLPLRWAPFRIGKLDLAPLAGIFLVFFSSELAERGLTALYIRLAL